MAVKYKVISKGQPGVKGGGTQQFYAVIVNQNVRDIDKITEAVSSISTVSGADIRAVIYAVVEVVNNFLEDGDIVRIGDLGSLRLSLSSIGKPTEDEVDASTIKATRTIFTAGKMFKNKIKTLQFEKDKQPTIKQSPALTKPKATAKSNKTAR